MKTTNLTLHQPTHRGFDRLFAENHLTLGLMLPIESYPGAVPTLENHAILAQQAEQLGFGALWVRDVPLHDPNFGDVGQIFDPWVYLGYLSAHTQTISLVTGSIVLPLRHPLHVAKAAASIDRLSGGRLILGIASGDRPVEFPAFGIDFETRGDRFRESLDIFEQVLENSFPTVDSPLGTMTGTDLLPKPVARSIPTLVTGTSRQTPEWIAARADGWMYYTRDVEAQAQTIEQWRALTQKYAPGTFKPFGQATYIDLASDPNTKPTPIHQGFRLGRNGLLEYLETWQDIGINHIVLNLKYGQRPASEVIEELAEYILPHFPTLPDRQPAPIERSAA
ncbi:MAG: LLM class oxidoreductase [Cyanobacteriota bacterium]|nr:LLM class oxidoreductase [Cyanobacteriota bacterium]